MRRHFCRIGATPLSRRVTICRVFSYFLSPANRLDPARRLITRYQRSYACGYSPTGFLRRLTNTERQEPDATNQMGVLFRRVLPHSGVAAAADLSASGGYWNGAGRGDHARVAPVPATTADATAGLIANASAPDRQKRRCHVMSPTQPYLHPPALEASVTAISRNI